LQLSRSLPCPLLLLARHLLDLGLSVEPRNVIHDVSLGPEAGVDVFLYFEGVVLVEVEQIEVQLVETFMEGLGTITIDYLVILFEEDLVDSFECLCLAVKSFHASLHKHTPRLLDSAMNNISLAICSF
jgi:hypothetical protein